MVRVHEVPSQAAVDDDDHQFSTAQAPTGTQLDQIKAIYEDKPKTLAEMAFDAGNEGVEERSAGFRLYGPILG
jgi:hypothetical protein